MTMAVLRMGRRDRIRVHATQATHLVRTFHAVSYLPTLTVILTGWPLAAYALIGRDDIAATLAAGTRTSAEGDELPQMQSPGARTPPPIGALDAVAADKQTMSDGLEATLSTPVQRSGTTAVATPAVTATPARRVCSETVVATAAEVFPPAYRQRLQIPSAVHRGNRILLL